MRPVTTQRLTDLILAALIALAIGLLFTWWVGAIVFVLGLAVIFNLKMRVAEWRRMGSGAEKAVQEDEWYYYHYQLHHSDTRKD